MNLACIKNFNKSQTGRIIKRMGSQSKLAIFTKKLNIIEVPYTITALEY